MVTTISPSQLSALLARTIPAGMPVLITGAPGIGKSDIVAQAATAAKAKLILSHPVVADPTDAKGLPWAEKGAAQATFLPFGELAEAISAKDPTVWFLDDLGQAAPAVQASYMQLLLARRVNGHALPDCVTFIAATNRRTDRAGVSGILEPVKSRFGTIVELGISLDDWVNWAFDHEVGEDLIAFLRFRPELLCKFTATADLTNSPMPRTWAAVDKITKLNLSHDIEQLAITGAVGEGAAVERLAFMKMMKLLPDLDGIVKNPDSTKIPTEPAVLYAVVTGLAGRVTVRNFKAIAHYASRLTEAQHGEFATLLMRDVVRREPGVMQSPEFVKIANSELGQLIYGGTK